MVAFLDRRKAISLHRKGESTSFGWKVFDFKKIINRVDNAGATLGATTNFSSFK